MCLLYTFCIIKLYLLDCIYTRIKHNVLKINNILKTNARFVKYKINYYGIILDFTTNGIVFAVISDLKSRSLLYVNGRRWVARGRGKKYWFFTIYSGECFEISKVIYSKSSLTAAAEWKSTQLKNEFTANTLYIIYIVFHVVNVFGAVYTDRKNWGFSTSSSPPPLPPSLCTSHRSGKIIAAADVKFDQDKVHGPKVMCRGVHMYIIWLSNGFFCTDRDFR